MFLVNHSKHFLGLFFTEGNLWHEQRRFVLRYLRDFGFGRRFQELELEINEEILNFINLLKSGPKYFHEQVKFEGSLISIYETVRIKIGCLKVA